MIGNLNLEWKGRAQYMRTAIIRCGVKSNSHLPLQVAFAFALCCGCASGQGTWYYNETMNGTLSEFVSTGSSSNQTINFINSNCQAGIQEGCGPGTDVWTGTVQPVFTWSGNGTLPTKVTILLTPGVGVDVNSPLQTAVSMGIDDGFGDSTTTFGNEKEVTSYVVKVLDGATTINPPPMTFNISEYDLPADSAARIEFVVSYGAQIIQPCLISATSTTNVPVSFSKGYVSGTNCSVTGTFPGFPPNSLYITSAQIMVNGTPIATYTSPNPSIPDPHYPSSITGRFDSTQFAPESILNATILCKDNQGNQYGGVLGQPTDGSSKFDVVVRNDALVLANHTNEFPDEIAVRGTVAGELAGPYSFLDGPSDQWNKTQILSENGLGENSLFFIYTHSAFDDFGDCYLNPIPGVDPEPDLCRAPEVEYAIANKLPSDPGFNFVNLQGCDTGSPEPVPYAPSFAIQNAFGITGDDRAFVGWPDQILVGDDEWSGELFAALRHGKLLWEAIEIADDAEPVVNANQTVLHPVINGDPSMTLTGLYDYFANNGG